MAKDFKDFAPLVFGVTGEKREDKQHPDKKQK